MLLDRITRQAPVLALAGLLVLGQAHASAAASVAGTFALSGSHASAEGRMQVAPTGPLSARLELTFSDAATGQPIIDFTEELTQELHLLAVDSTLSRLVHEHVKQAGPDGVFHAKMRFPRAGLYHIFADVVPAGMSQQVLRFDVTIGESAGSPQTGLASPHVASEGTVSVTSGPYQVNLDLSQLRPEQDAPVGISITRDGQPATDLAPYLGVGAHAVLIRAEDLAYVHAHPTDGAETGHAEGHGNHGGGHSPAAAPTSLGHGGHDHGHAPQTDVAAVSPDMTLHLRAPGTGRYTLFLEFIGEGAVHTLAVPLLVQ